MMLNSSSMLFICTMMTGVMVSISSNNWMMMWSGLEINSMSIIPLMTSKKKMTSESTIKYFIIQGISSSLLILGIIMMMKKQSYMTDLIILTSLLIKIGLAPFHNWVMTVLEGLTLINVFLMISIIKIPPLYILSLFGSINYLIIIITMMVGSISSLNQNSIRSIIAYSSIFNMGFVYFSIKYNSIWIMFMFIYSLINLMLITILIYNNISYINQMMFKMMNPFPKISIWMCILSLGGVPPMLGFFMKLLVLELAINSMEKMMLFIIILSSTIIMFSYMRMMFISMMFYSMMLKWFLYKNMNLSQMILSLNFIIPVVFILIKLFL